MNAASFRTPPSGSTAPVKVWHQRDFLRFLMCSPFYLMMLLLVVEAALSATTTALIIRAGQDVADQEFLVSDFVWIVVAQSVSYLVGACSWIYAERAGFGAYGRYMLQFARINRYEPALLGDRLQRDHTEPFLTNEVFHIFFELVYELEADLKLFFGLVFNAIVLGIAIDAGLPAIYAVVFVALLVLQWFVRRPVAAAYLAQQRTTNRMTAHTYAAWDNITAGNRYNYQIWHKGFKSRLRGALNAQIRAILAREGLAAVSGIFALIVVFSYLAWVAGQNVADSGLLVALAATLPRQIELSYSVHGLASGWNDLLAVWTRMGGACVAIQPESDAAFDKRIKFDALTLSDQAGPLSFSSLDEAVTDICRRTRGHLQVRGHNGAGKSTLLVALKARLGSDAFYWPTGDKLSFAFATQAKTGSEEAEGEGADGEITHVGEEDPTGTHLPQNPTPEPAKAAHEPGHRAGGYSSGEKQLMSLTEIVSRTRCRIYLLDEWDANLDAKNRAKAEGLVAELARRAVVVEISHHTPNAPP